MFLFSLFQMFISAFVDVAGHSGKLESAYEILQEARSDGMEVGIISYSSLMGACSNVYHTSCIYEFLKLLVGIHRNPSMPVLDLTSQDLIGVS